LRRKRRSADNREFYQEALKEQEKYKNMKEELKKRYRCRYITEALISIVIGIFIMGTQYGNIKIWMKPAINLEDLRAEDIRQNNIKVKGVITDVAGEYEYWTGGDASFAHMEKEFVILVNGSYIALIPPYGDWEDRFYNNMNLTKEYSDGDKEAKERMESIEVEGTIKKLGMGLDAYRDYAYSVREETGEKTSFLPYGLYVNDMGGMRKGGIVFFLGLGGFFVLFGMSVFIRYFMESYLKLIEKYCDTAENTVAVYRKVEQLFARPMKYKDVRISEDLIAIYTAYNVCLLDADQIIWIYQYQWSYSIYLIPVIRTRSIIFRMKNGRKVKIKMKNRKAYDEIYIWLRQTHPYFYYGYTPEYKKEYQKNRQTMIQKIEKCRSDRKEVCKMQDLGYNI